MNVTVSLEQRFQRTPDGAVWTNGSLRGEFWRRYLEIFDAVRVVARIEDVETVPDSYVRGDSSNVSFLQIPYYVGPIEYATRVIRIRAAVRNIDWGSGAVIMRVPSWIASHIGPELYRRNQPFGLEVVADPYDVLGPGALRHPLRPFFRSSMVRQLRRQCLRACAVAYVTEHALQNRYPCRAYTTDVSDVQLLADALVVEDVFTTSFSSVELSEAAYVSGEGRSAGGTRLLTVGSLAQPYKGVQHLLSALDVCVRRGLDAQLTVVGDGRYREALERQAAALGLSARVRFLGTLPAGAAVREEMDRAHLFVLASLSEGLPRVIIEAMARAKPCIATSVGGIPELLQPEDLVAPGDPEALAAKIVEVARDGPRMARMSRRNLARARDFSEPVLRERRLRFYRHLRDVTDRWVGLGRGREPGA